MGARVALLWRHSANAKCQRVHACTRSVPGLRKQRDDEKLTRVAAVLINRLNKTRKASVVLRNLTQHLH